MKGNVNKVRDRTENVIISVAVNIVGNMLQNNGDIIIGIEHTIKDENSI